MKLEKLFLAFAWLIFGECTLIGSDKMPYFLEGTWKVDQKETYEEWKKGANGVLNGLGYKLVNGEQRISEVLCIKPMAGGVVYSAKVATQNEGRAVDFALNRLDDTTFLFENAKHDFPKKIVYKLLDTGKLFVQVLGTNDQGFSFEMTKQKHPPIAPDWFREFLKKNVGEWTADNSQYQSDQEPFDSYGMTWEWGVCNTSITGRLYGILADKRMKDFWEYRYYWDNEKQQAILMQYGVNGVMGRGELIEISPGRTHCIQTFTTVDGRQWMDRHITDWGDHQALTSSAYHNGNEEWIENRKYTWHKKKVEVSVPELGAFSVSLAVKDLKASYAFYKDLGFKKVEGKGGIQDKWMILGHGEIKIGLYQGMFPTNTLTFNPQNARKMYKHLKISSHEFLFEIGTDKTEGPCSFSISDPDGNILLIDQH